MTDPASARKAAYVPDAGARRAASLLLVRDIAHGAPGLEVLMLRRAERAHDLNSGAAVFPGGVLAASDRQAHQHCVGPSDAQASDLLGLAEGGLDYYLAAARETFEEVGLLLADAASPVDSQALFPWRSRLNAGTTTPAEFCEACDLRWDLRDLVYYSHWLTPLGAPKRFDTRFFITHAPAPQQAQADMAEAVELMWLTPAQALDPERGLKLLPVTRVTLMELARHASAQAAVEHARSRQSQVQLIQPRAVLRGSGRGVVLPGDAAYAEIGRVDPEGRCSAYGEIEAGRVVRLSPRVQRLTAPNPGPMTGPGTNSYLVAPVCAEGAGPRPWTVIDPGPLGAPGHAQSHLEALLAAADHGHSGVISQILVTHTHRDHSPLAAALSRVTGAPVLGRVAIHAQWQDPEFQPQRQLVNGERLVLGADCTLRVLHTPGHASNHLCFLLEEEQTLFTGDHVMQGSTVVINPPDGDMVAYLASLHELLALPAQTLQWLAPGHGFLVDKPQQVLQALIAHRLKRHRKVASALEAARSASLSELVSVVYDDVPAALHGMAQRSLLAHLLGLHHEGRAHPEGGAALPRHEARRWQWSE